MTLVHELAVEMRAGLEMALEAARTRRDAEAVRRVTRAMRWLERHGRRGEAMKGRANQGVDEVCRG